MVVAPGDLHERLPIDELLTGGWQSEGSGRLPTLAKEPFNTGRPKEQEDAGFRRIDVERVRDVARVVDKGAS